MGGIKVEQEQFDAWLAEKNEDYLSYIGKMDESEILARCSKGIELFKEKERFQWHWDRQAKMHLLFWRRLG